MTVSTDWSWPTSSGPSVGDVVIPADVLLTMTLAYHTAQYRGSVAAEQASRDLLLRLRPVNDADMGRWIDAFNRLLAAQQQQQALLTQAYIKQTLALYRVQEVALRVIDSTRAAEDLLTFTHTPEFKHTPESLRAEVFASLRRLNANKEATLRDHLLADRARNLASPVIKVRTELSQGATLPEAVDTVAKHVEGLAYDAGRAAERLGMEGIGWPSFKNGHAMLYKRVTTPGACGWCQIVATRLYAAASAKASAQWHRGCRCSWQLVDFQTAKTYADTHAQDGYYAAARAAGLWEGDAPLSYADYITENRAKTGAADVQP